MGNRTRFTAARILATAVFSLVLSAVALAAQQSTQTPEERGCGVVPCDNGWPERGWSRTGDHAWSLERAITLFGFNPFDPMALRREFTSDFGQPGSPPPQPPPTQPPTPEPPPTQPPTPEPPPTQPPTPEPPPTQPPTPEPPPTQPAEFSVTGDTNIVETHIIGSDPCPQELGRFTIANTGGSFLEYSISAPAMWLELVGTDGRPIRMMNSLSGGESLVVIVRFTCSNFGGPPPSGQSKMVSSSFSVSAVDGNNNSLGSQNISVKLTIQN